MDNESRANQLKVWNTTLGTLDKWVTLGYVEAFARVVQAHNMVDLALPMYYKVWFLCLLGKFYVQLGQYEKGSKQVLTAVIIWDGKGGWRGPGWDGNESAKRAHDKMLGGTLNLCDLGIQGKLDARGERWKEAAWDLLVSRFETDLRNNNLAKKRPTDSEVRDVSDKVEEACADGTNLRDDNLSAERPTDSEIEDVSETLGKVSLLAEDEARPSVSEKANMKE